MRCVLAFVALVMPAAAFAASAVTLDSSVFVERVAEDAAGAKTLVLEAPKVVTPGDRLLFVLSYSNGGDKPATDFVVTNPVPDAVVYSEAEGEGALVSVDGGKSWGDLQALKVRASDGAERTAQPADVTHIRWTFSKPIPAGQTGKLSFRGVVK